MLEYICKQNSMYYFSRILIRKSICYIFREDISDEIEYLSNVSLLKNRSNYRFYNSV